MSSHDNHTVIAPNGCPIDSTPPDPTHLFSSNGINLDLPRVGWILSGILTVLSTGISLVLIFRHYQYYTKPDQQRYIVRMLLMVPIYAITSWFSFVYVREAVYYDSIRVLYEAFVIASFFILMLQYMGSTLEDQRKVLRQHKKTERWFFPMCCLKYNPSRPHFLQYMKWGILQYVPLNILGTILTIVLESQGNYCENSWNPKFGHIWVLGSYTISVTIATYFLIMFYFTIRLELKQYDPFYKFLAVKLVVFFSFWQMVVIEGLVYFGLIKGTTYWSTNDISTGINAVLIDIEMVFFAIMHLRAFSYKPYVPKIPNPELGKVEDTAEAKLLEDNHLDLQGPENSNNNNNNSNNRRNERSGRASLDSIDMNEIPARKGTRASANQGHPKDGSQSQSKSKKQGSGKKGKKDKSPPETVLDFTQKTPIWRGLIDSFNPLDLIRELAYGVKYMYRWARGIPVDKDSKRLLDLEKAFGRVRPEVPYVPPKEKKKKKKKKKKTWWGGKKTDSEGEDEDDNSKASGDDDDDEDDEEDDDSDIGSGKRKDRNNDQDYEKTLDEGKRRKNDRELYDSDLEENRRGQDYRSDNTTRGQRSKMKMDSAYDMGYDPSRNGLGYPIRNDTMARGSGSKHAYASVGRKSARPIAAAAAGGASSSGAGVNSLGKAAGKTTGKAHQQTLHKKGSGSAAFLTKDEASHTERATLPDIQPGPVPKKFALSGFDESIPLPSRRVLEEDRASTTTSFDVPMPAASTIPVPYRPTHQHPAQSSEDYYYEKPRLHSERRYGEHEVVDMEPVHAEGRGAPRPFDYDRFAFDPSFSARNPRSSGGTFGRERPTNLTQHKNTNFVSKDDPGRFEDFRNSRSTGAETFGYSHGRLDSGETSPFPMSTTSSEKESVRRHFYHLRDGSHSDPELSHYGNSHEFYVEQLHTREPQGPPPNQERSKGKTVVRAQEDKETVDLAPDPALSTRRENDPGNSHDAVAVVEDSISLIAPSRSEDPKLPDHEDHSVPKHVKLKQEEEEEEEAAAEIVDNEPVARIDPIVAEYSIIQRRQQELQQQNQDQKQEQEQHHQRQPQQLQPQSRQSSTVSKQQPRQLLLRRRNSLDSVDSARSSSSGGGPRYARRMYMRDYYSGIGHRQPIAPLPALPMHIPLRSNRQGFPVEDVYGRTYGYSMRMPEPQYIPPSRYYRYHPEPDIPVDRSRGGREGDGYSGRPWPEPERGLYYPPPPAPATRQLPLPMPTKDGPMPMQMPEPMQEQRFFMPVPEYERSPPTLPQSYSSRPNDSGPRLGGPVPHKRRDEGSIRGSNLRYQSPPTGRVVEPPVPVPPNDRQEQYRSRPGASSRYQEWNRDRGWERERERDRGRDRDPRYYAQDPRTVRDPYGATPESLYPVSRYAAPYLRDYEYRQREETRRQRGPP